MLKGVKSSLQFLMENFTFREKIRIDNRLRMMILADELPLEAQLLALEAEERSWMFTDSPFGWRLHNVLSKKLMTCEDRRIY